MAVHRFKLVDETKLFRIEGADLLAPIVARAEAARAGAEAAAASASDQVYYNAVGAQLDVWTRELSPGSNRYVRTRMLVENRGTRSEIWRVTGCWLAQRTAPNTYADIHQIIGDPPNGLRPLEIRALETNQASFMGTLNDQAASAYPYYADGRELLPSGGVFSGRARRFEIAQRSPLFRPSDGALIAAQRSRHILHADGFTYEFDFEVVEAFSLSNLLIGMLPILKTSGATTIFDKVRRGPRWNVFYDLLAPVDPDFIAEKDQSTAFKYSGPAGVGVEMSIALGSDWTHPNRIAYIDADGRAFFDWRNTPYSGAVPPGTHIRGAIHWRFSFGGNA